MAFRRSLTAISSSLTRTLRAPAPLVSRGPVASFPTVSRRDDATFSATPFSATGLRGFSSVVETQSPIQMAIKNPTAEIMYDESVHQRSPPGDHDKAAFTYLVLTGGRFIYASALRALVLKLIISMTASRDVLALASLEVDIEKIEVGQCVTVKWRGKPVFIRRRNAAEQADALDCDVAELRDPQTDAERTVDPEWLICLGVCTHLGCVPLANAGDYGGWFCPCHGSHYDISGRIRKGPAPYNLEVPEYEFTEPTKLMIG